MNARHEIRFEEWINKKREEAHRRGGREETVNAFSIVLDMLDSIQGFEKKQQEEKRQLERELAQKRREMEEI